MDELSQWCEIDGHSWVCSYMSYGLMLGPKTVHMYKQCSFCKIVEDKVFIPYDEEYKLPIMVDTLSF